MNSQSNSFIPLDRHPFRAWDVLALSMIVVYWLTLLAVSPASTHQNIVDDAYIFQRVVDNLWDGNGWTYNSDAQVNPITAPLYVFVLAGAKVFQFPAPVTMSLVYLLSLIALGVGIYLGMRHHHRTLAWIMAIVVSSASVPVMSWGMETSIFLACIVFSILAYTKGNYLTAGLFCTFTALSRPEGIALIGIIAGAHLIEERKISWGMIAIFCITLAPWLLFSWTTYGHILPNSVSVKAMQPDIGWWKEQHFWLRALLTQPWMPWVTYPLAGLGLYQAIREYISGHRFLLLVMAFGALQVTAYSLMDAPVGYFWYFAPGNMTLDMAIVLGAFRLWDAIIGYAEAKKVLNLSESERTAFIAVMVLIGMTRLATAPLTLVKPFRLGSEYTAAGKWIDQNTPNDHVVAATEIGYIGYYSRRQIRDIHGLIHPEALGSLKNEEWDWWFKSDPPQVIVMHNPPWNGEPLDGIPWQAQSLQDFNDQYRRMISFGEVEVYQWQANIAN